MARTEYYDDPAAPEPNSLVVAASAVVTGAEGRVLLQRRRDNDLCALPGGGMEMTGSLPGTAVREEIDRLPMHHTQRLRIRHFLEHSERPPLG
ncbi:MAG TPA: NUDIX domain-containing protein [Streptomyces sp.]|uniref:NUDIX domain-containing protein n=1 Tax=Streptomyces sp. TaxID=1931 RepID=UPI002C137D77|nr:NUDIX domain-containing protein [Streptomyces sp.]HWU09431.1 NUDIX domain-containing protein [Streptomyces sp.]